MFSSVCSCFCTGPRGCPFSGVPFKGEPLVCFDGVSSFDLVLGAMADAAACSRSAYVIRGPSLASSSNVGGDRFRQAVD